MADAALAKIRELFETAIELPPAERPSYLARECAGHAELRERVEALLCAAEDDAPFLRELTAGQSGPCAVTATGAEEAALSGTSIGPYTLLEQIGEGGFGVVFLAEQREPVRRRVALKVVKQGMDTRQVIARFEAERQALAMMDHPNIARVLDAGATDASCPLGPGRPYFVMELVKGAPITRFCDETKLGLSERLALFVDACRAVQHAHQKGIIHRDLKPTNVLVSRYDDKPVVKIIDFGIAKATGAAGGRLTDKTFFTGFRQLMGTPAYMSPEQAGMSDLDVDTRCDIYALGVLLYELLTGTTPLDATRLVSAGLDEMRRIIREEEPPRPSTRVGTLSLKPAGNHQGTAPPTPAARASGDTDRRDSAIDVTRRRGTDPRSLTRLLHGDLDWIAMKALEKDRTRRYDTATDLAQDVERFLNHEPVVAGPPGRLYRMRKFVRRNRALVTGAVLVGAALLMGLSGTTYFLLQAQRQREQAETARAQTEEVAGFQAEMLTKFDASELGRGIKEILREEAREALAREYVGDSPPRHQRTTEEVDAELVAFDRLLGTAHAVDVASEVLDRYVLAPAAESLEQRFGDQPLVRAQLHHAIGRIYAHVERREQAEAHFRHAIELRQQQVGEVDAKLADTLYELANLRLHARDSDEARQLLRRALAIWREVAPDSSAVGAALDGLAIVARMKGNRDESERLCREALEVRRAACDPGDPVIALNLTNLGETVAGRGDRAEAEKLMTEALQIHRAAAEPNREWTATTMRRLAVLRAQRGEFATATPLLHEALDILRERRPSGDPQVADFEVYFGKLLSDWGDHDGGEKLLLQAIESTREAWGASDPRVEQAKWQLAVLYKNNGQTDDAEKLYREVLDARQSRLGDEHAGVADGLKNLGYVLEGRGPAKDEEAERVLLRALQMFRRLPGKHESQVVQTLKCLANVRSNRGDNAGAEKMFREALAIESRLGGKGFWYARVLTEYASHLRRTGSADRALPLALEARAWFEHHEPGLIDSDELATRNAHGDVLEEIACIHCELGQWADGEKTALEALAIREGFESDEPRAKIFMLLGDARSQQKKYRLAEQDYRKVLEILGKRYGSAHSWVPLCHEHIAEMLRWQGKAPEAAASFLEAIEIRRHQPPDERLAEDLAKYANDLHRSGGDRSEALRAARESVEVLEQLAAASPQWRAEHQQANRILVRLLVDSGQPDEAVAAKSEFVEQCRRHYADDKMLLGSALVDLGRSLLAQSAFEAAESVFRECWTMRKQQFEPSDSSYWLVWNAQSLLGGALVGQGAALGESDPAAAIAKFTVAEPLLVEAATWLTSNTERVSERVRAVRLREAVERIVTLYDAWHDAAGDGAYAAKADEWRNRLAELSDPR